MTESKTHKNFIVSITHLNLHQFDTSLLILQNTPTEHTQCSLLQDHHQLLELLVLTVGCPCLHLPDGVPQWVLPHPLQGGKDGAGRICCQKSWCCVQRASRLAQVGPSHAAQLCALCTGLTSSQKAAFLCSLHRLLRFTLSLSGSCRAFWAKQTPVRYYGVFQNLKLALDCYFY